jgi:3-oxoacyl-[acyl-carrier protein] reductase
MTRNRTALVTGGTRGIGRGIVERLVRHGYHVVFSGRDHDAGSALVESFAADGGRAIFHAANLRDSKETQELVATAVDELGSLDVVVHSAGIYPEHSLDDMTLTDWHDVLDTNLTSAVLLAKASADHLAASGSGRLVFISSITGPRTGISGLAHYGASKGGLEGLMRALAVELAPRGITVNAVAPGTILTESLAELYSQPGMTESVTAIIPAGRLGLPSDIAAAVEFLASPDAGFVTGQSLIVDGGQMLPEVQGSS